MSSSLFFIIIAAVFANQLGTIWGQQSCSQDSECPEGQCCLLGPARYSIPSCIPFQQKNDQCRVNAETVTTTLRYPDNSTIEAKGVNYILCPCAKELSCDKKTGMCA